MLLQKLKDDNLAARKQGNAVAASLLSTLYAEAAIVGKNAGNRESSDEEVTSVIRKFLKNNSEACTVIKDEQRLSVLQQEGALLESYLPKMASEDEVRAFIAECVATLTDKSPKGMGSVMGKLKAKFGATYDGAKASAWVKEALAN